jgi:hypothetical protein
VRENSREIWDKTGKKYMFSRFWKLWKKKGKIRSKL